VSEVYFVERKAAPRPLMRLSVRFHFAYLSTSVTVLILETLGVQRAQLTVHDWVRKVELQPANRHDSNHVTADETVIRLGPEQCRLYAAIDPEERQMTAHTARAEGKQRSHITVSCFAPRETRR